MSFPLVGEAGVGGLLSGEVSGLGVHVSLPLSFSFAGDVAETGFSLFLSGISSKRFVKEQFRSSLLNYLCLGWIDGWGKEDDESLSSGDSDCDIITVHL